MYNYGNTVWKTQSFAYEEEHLFNLFILISHISYVNNMGLLVVDPLYTYTVTGQMGSGHRRCGEGQYGLHLHKWTLIQYPATYKINSNLKRKAAEGVQNSGLDTKFLDVVFFHLTIFIWQNIHHG